jgi:hypothetical protein
MARETFFMNVCKCPFNPFYALDLPAFVLGPALESPFDSFSKLRTCTQRASRIFGSKDRSTQATPDGVKYFRIPDAQSRKG